MYLAFFKELEQMHSCHLETFNVRNIKPIPNNIEFVFFYINDDFLFFNKIEAQLRYIKSGDSETLVIEYRNSVYPDSVYKLENATSLHFRIE